MDGYKKSNLTTLCYLERDDKYLMMHRVKKEHDINHDKWVGVGGHFEPNESPEECLLREVKEETGVTLERFRLRGIITFESDAWQTEYMFLYTADRWHGDFIGRDDGREGTLAWVEKALVPELPIWEGDKIFFKLMEKQNRPVFSLKLRYVGDKLVEKVLDGKEL